MYFAVTSDMPMWKNRIVQATFLGEPADYAPHWWDCQSLTKFPEQFSFLIYPDAPQPDAYFTGAGIELYSSRLIQLLEAMHVQCETFPATLIVKNDGRVPNTLISDTYRVFHLLAKRSLPSIRIRNEQGKVVSTASDTPLFRIERYEDLVIMHKDLQALLVKEKITGFAYRPFK